MSAQQLARFGAELFVVDLVTIGVLRELGVLLTAIIVAGRSGSAFAAEIGSMQLNEEVDALRAIGVDTFEALVLPRIIGLDHRVAAADRHRRCRGPHRRRAAVQVPAGHPAAAVPDPHERGHRADHLLGGPR